MSSAELIRAAKLEVKRHAHGCEIVRNAWMGDPAKGHVFKAHGKWTAHITAWDEVVASKTFSSPVLAEVWACAQLKGGV